MDRPHRLPGHRRIGGRASARCECGWATDCDLRSESEARMEYSEHLDRIFYDEQRAKRMEEGRRARADRWLHAQMSSAVAAYAEHPWRTNVTTAVTAPVGGCRYGIVILASDGDRGKQREAIEKVLRALDAKPEGGEAMSGPDRDNQARSESSRE